MREIPGFLGTGASLLSDLSLLAYVLIILPALIVGFVFARRKMFFPHHRNVMTAIVIFNWILILWLMVASYSQGVAPGIPANLGDIGIWLPTLHGIIGILAQLLGTYLVLRMWFENQLPDALKVKNIKLYMRLTLAGWTLTALMGIGIYTIWYAAPAVATDANIPAPAATEEVIPVPDATEDVIPTPETAEDLIPTPEATEDLIPMPETTEEA